MTYADIAVMDLIIKMRDAKDQNFQYLGRDEERKNMPEKYISSYCTTEPHMQCMIRIQWQFSKYHLNRYPLLGQLSKKVLENKGIQGYFKDLKELKEKQKAEAEAWFEIKQKQDP